VKITEAELRSMRQRVSGGVVVHTQDNKGLPSPNVSVHSPFKSKLEAAYATYLHGLQLAGDISLYRYEPMTIKLTADVRYTPDFYVRFPTGREEWHEVKPHTKRILSREGRLKARVAAKEWGLWHFIEVERVQGQWTQKELSSL
jgi:hypothetical protein